MLPLNTYLGQCSCTNWMPIFLEILSVIDLKYMNVKSSRNVHSSQYHVEICFMQLLTTKGAFMSLSINFLLFKA